MSNLTKEQKAKIITEYAICENDTGSPEVQIAVLTAEILRLNEHLQSHIHDFHSKHGLLKKVGRRRNLLKYLAAKNIPRYRRLIDSL